MHEITLVTPFPGGEGGLGGMGAKGKAKGRGGKRQRRQAPRRRQRLQGRQATKRASPPPGAWFAPAPSAGAAERNQVGVAPQQTSRPGIIRGGLSNRAGRNRTAGADCGLPHHFIRPLSFSSISISVPRAFFSTTLSSFLSLKDSLTSVMGFLSMA